MLLLAVMIVSPRSANTNAFGIDAPRRLSMSAFGIATTSAVTVRVHCCMTGAAAAGALVAAGVMVAGATTGLADAVGVTPGGVSVFTDSVSALGDSVAGFAFSSLAGDDGFEAAAVN